MTRTVHVTTVHQIREGLGFAAKICFLENCSVGGQDAASGSNPEMVGHDSHCCSRGLLQILPEELAVGLVCDNGAWVLRKHTL
jgi:hypothetical protein